MVYLQKQKEINLTKTILLVMIKLLPNCLREAIIQAVHLKII
jgi:hypothetical protein